MICTFTQLPIESLNITTPLKGKWSVCLNYEVKQVKQITITNLEVLFPVEDDRLGLDLAIFDIHFVTTENNWDILTDSDQVPVPIGDVLVGDAGSDIEHDDSTVGLNIVTVSQPSKLFLPCCVPHIKSGIRQLYKQCYPLIQ